LERRAFDQQAVGLGIGHYTDGVLRCFGRGLLNLRTAESATEAAKTAKAAAKSWERIIRLLVLLLGAVEQFVEHLGHVHGAGIVDLDILEVAFPRGLRQEANQRLDRRHGLA